MQRAVWHAGGGAEGVYEIRNRKVDEMRQPIWYSQLAQLQPNGLHSFGKCHESTARRRSFEILKGQECYEGRRRLQVRTHLLADSEVIGLFLYYFVVTTLKLVLAPDSEKIVSALFFRMSDLRRRGMCAEQFSASEGKASLSRFSRLVIALFVQIVSWIVQALSLIHI